MILRLLEWLLLLEATPPFTIFTRYSKTFKQVNCTSFIIESIKLLVPSLRVRGSTLVGLNDTCGSGALIEFLSKDRLILKIGLLIVIEGFVHIGGVEGHWQNKIVLEYRRIVVLMRIIVRQEPVVFIWVIEATGCGAGTCCETIVGY